MIKIYGMPLSTILLYGMFLHAAIWMGVSHGIELLVYWYFGVTISLALAPPWHALIMTTLIIATSFTGYLEEREQAARQSIQATQDPTGLEQSAAPLVPGNNLEAPPCTTPEP